MELRANESALALIFFFRGYGDGLRGKWAAQRMHKSLRTATFYLKKFYYITHAAKKV
jgi:hypothetical protein